MAEPNVTESALLSQAAGRVMRELLEEEESFSDAAQHAIFRAICAAATAGYELADERALADLRHELENVVLLPRGLPGTMLGPMYQMAQAMAAIADERANLSLPSEDS